MIDWLPIEAKMILYQFFILTTSLTWSMAVGQVGSLSELENTVKSLQSSGEWSMEKGAKLAAVNGEILKIVTADTLKSSEDFMTAARLVQYDRGGLSECRLRYELTLTAMALGNDEAARAIASSWDQFLMSTGRRQHFGTQKALEGLQADKYKVQAPVTCVQTVLLNPEEARKLVKNLEGNDELRRLVEEDQKVRQGDWSKLTQEQLIAISREDDARRARLRSMLADIKIMTAQDYQDAALIMPHGCWWDDFALAHELALCATVLDPAIGRQLAALSYDRMLEYGGYLQRVGTQYHGRTLAEVDSVGFNDTMRKALGRKPLGEVEKVLGSGP